MIPTYIFDCLDLYGNTIVTIRNIRKLGGKEKFLEALKLAGYDCVLKEPSSKITYNGRIKAYDHLVIVER